MNTNNVNINNVKINITKVIIWGHPLHSHTHSYIHYGFYKAFSHLGYNTLWLDNTKELTTDLQSNENILFITEGQVDQYIPIIKGCYYLLHNCDLTKYRDAPIHILLLQVYTKKCTNIPYIIRIDRYIYYDKTTSEFPTLFMPWATDLLPNEIEENMNLLEKYKGLNTLTNPRVVNFVGMLTPEWMKVKQFCLKNNLYFRAIGGYKGDNVDTNTNQKLIQTSYIAPAIQTEWQVENGYIPCRIFKNISYGKMGITNNQTVAEIFNGNIIYHPEINKTLDLALQFEKQNPIFKKSRMLFLMEYVKQKHTYLNRIQVILNCFQN